MNSERQKTDAIVDVVEIPEGATHYRNGDFIHNIKYYKHQFGKWYFYSYSGGWYPSGIVISVDQLRPL